MPELNFNVYCGICGGGICQDAEVDAKNNVTVTCHFCQEKIENLEGQIEDLHGEVLDLKNE